MSPRAENRRHHTWLMAIVADPYRKLASLGLAIGLWYFLDSQIADVREVDYRPRAIESVSAAANAVGSRSELFVVLPTDLVTPRRFVDAATGKLVDTVQVVFDGPKHLVAALERARPRFTAGPFEDIEWRSRPGFEFGASDLHTTDPAVLGVRVLIKPARVRVDIEPNRTVDFPVRMENCEVTFAAGDDTLADRLRKDSAAFTSTLVRVSGPASSVDHFPPPGQKPFQVVLQKDGRALAGQLRLNTDDEALHADQLPRLNIELLPEFKEYKLELPVLVDDLSLPEAEQGRFRPRERRKLVRLRAAGALLAQLTSLADDEQHSAHEVADWARQNLRLVVWIPRGAEATEAPVLPARLEWLGVLGNSVDPTTYGLAQQVSITLERRP